MLSIKRMVGWLAEPHPSIESNLKRRTARLFSVLMLTHVALVIAGTLALNAILLRVAHRNLWNDLDTWVTVAGAAIHLVCWALLRSGRYRTGITLYIFSTAAVSLTGPFMPDPNAEIGLLPAAMLPVFLAAMFFSVRWVLATIAMVVLAGAWQLSTSSLPPHTLGTGYAILVVVGIGGVLIVVLRDHLARIERERADEARSAGDLMRSFVDNSLMGVVVLDEVGRVVEWNQAQERTTGVSAAQAKGRYAWDVVADSLELGTEGKTSQQYQQWLLGLLRGDAANPGLPVETEHVLRDGRRLTMLEAMYPVRTSIGTRLVSISHDITERKSAQQVLEATEARYRDLFDTVSDGIIIGNRRGVVVEANPAACRQLGYDRPELLGMRLDRISTRSEQAIIETMRSLDESGGSCLQQREHRRKDGSTMRVELALSRITFRGEPAYLALVRDLTERHRAEAERRKLEDRLQQAGKMESIGMLAGGVAHDFNNLLTAIRGNTALALEGTVPSHASREALQEIDKAACTAANLTRQLLAFSRRQLIEPRSLNLNEVIDNMKRMLERLIGEDVQLRTVTAPELWAVMADPGLIEQVIVNLAANARDAMPDGGSLLIETSNEVLDGESGERSSRPTTGQWVRLVVSDTGQGMVPEVAARVFEPFFTTKAKGRGTGLGLATTYGAIKQSGGDIEVQSEPGKGTTFTIRLPRTETSARPAVAPEVEVRRGTETILLVEDEEYVRKLSSRALQRFGYRVIVAADGAEALRIVQEQAEPIDLILTDVVMPGVNGRQLAEQVLKIQPRMRVLFTSGYAEDAIAHRGVLDAGIHFIGKPYTPRGLASKVREVLDGAASPGGIGADIPSPSR